MDLRCWSHGRPNHAAAPASTVCVRITGGPTTAQLRVGHVPADLPTATAATAATADDVGTCWRIAGAINRGQRQR